MSIGGDAKGPVSATHIGTQILGVSALPIGAAARDPGPVFTAAGVDTFTGRRWLTEILDGFMAANACGYIFVEAEAGMGKTAFAAWLVSTRGYLSHFSRYAGGRTARTALQNLSAQLIRDFSLADQAPGGMLPEWAQTPGGFEVLLGKAAGKAVAQGRRVVVVVDGLDEAESCGDEPAFGLPALLPAGAYVIGTYRTGYSPARPDCPTATTRIGRDDVRNVADVRAYLTRAASEEILAARLALARMEPADFVELLTSRCDGVWVYLRYLLEEVRLGLRQPQASDLPAGVWNYYADQLRRWQQDPAWNQELLPVLAVLGAAGEALPGRTLARLAGGVPADAVRRGCDLVFRPLLSAAGGAASGEPLRYEIYHASFREVLSGQHDLASAGPGPRYPYDLLALADKLRQATLTAHSRIAGTYLDGFGGIDAGLPALAGNPAAAGADDGYPLRHLARHLQLAGRASDLCRLLDAGQPAGDGNAVNVWFAAHDHAGCLVAYLDDLTRARDASAAAVDEAVASGHVAPALGAEIRYTFMAASVISRNVSIPPALLEALIAAGVWSRERGLDHARRLTDPARRASALGVILRHWQASEQAALIAEAWSACTAITRERDRASVLGILAPFLPAELLAQALAAARAMTRRYLRTEAVAGLAPQLSPRQRAEALTEVLAAAIASGDEFALADSIDTLAPCLSAELLAQAAAAARGVTGEDLRARALTALALAPHLPPSQQPETMSQALAAAEATANEAARSRAISALAPHLPAHLLGRALTAALASPNSVWRIRTVSELAPYLPGKQRREVLARSLAEAPAIADDITRAAVLAGLAPHLPPDQQAETVATILTVTRTWLSENRDHGEDLTKYALAKTLAHLAPQLPPAQRTQTLAQALTAARTTRGLRAALLDHLSPHLPTELLAQAHESAIRIGDDRFRARALAGLAPHLPADERTAAIAQALTAATAAADTEELAKLLASLAPELPAELFPRALALAAGLPDAHLRADALAGMAPHLPAGLLPAALTAAAKIKDDYSRVRAQLHLARCLPADQQAEILTRVRARAARITEARLRAIALAQLAPHLPAGQQAQTLRQAVTTAATAGDLYWLAMELARLAPQLPGSLLPQALSVVTHLPGDRERAHALASIAPHLPARLLPRALAAASTISGKTSRAKALAALVPCLPAGQRTEILAEALAGAAGADPEDRARVVASLGPALPGGQREEILTHALDAALAIPGSVGRANALANLAPHLPAPLLGRALAGVVAASDDFTSSRHPMADVAPCLPAELLAQALRATPDGQEDVMTFLLERARSLLPSLAGTQILGMLRDSLRNRNRETCFVTAAVLAPVIAQLGGPSAAHQCVQAITDVHRWWP